MNSLHELLGLRKPALVSPKPRTIGSNYEMQANDPASLHETQTALQDETSDRIFQTERLGAPFGDELRALKGLFLRRQNQMRDGTVETQRPIVDQINAGQQDAILGGFTGSNPMAEHARYERGFNERKMNVPVEAQRVAGQYDLQGRQISAQGQMDVTRQQGENQLNYQDLVGQQAGDYRKWVDQRQASGMGGDVAPFNPRTGAMGAIRAPRDPNIIPLLNKFAEARGNIGDIDPYDPVNQTNPRVREFNQHWAGILSNHPAQDDAKADVQKILRNPQTRNLQVEDLTDPSVDDAAYIEELRDLLNLARGGR